MHRPIDFTPSNQNLQELVHITDAVRHLKLLYAFDTLRRSVIIGITDTAYETKVWTGYVTLAVRRFNIWLNSLSKFSKPPKNADGLKQFVNDNLPPIDILMIWHTFLLSPKSCYDNFKRMQFDIFLDVPFPLSQVDEHIDDQTFIYAPPTSMSSAFVSLMQTYLQEQRLHEPWNIYTYNSYAPFDPFSVQMTLKCPICNTNLGTCHLVDSNNTGFSDSGFRVTSHNNCNCGFKPVIDKSQLNSRLLYHDAKQFKYLFSVIKHFDRSLYKVPVWMRESTTGVDHYAKARILVNDQRYKASDLPSFIRWLSDLHLNKSTLVILEEYLAINPISLTIPANDSLIIHDDLVSRVMEQQWFNNVVVHDTDILHSLSLVEIMTVGSDRYLKFLDLMSQDLNFDPVPTLDIALFWHTHLLNHTGYRKYTMTRCGRYVDHHETSQHEDVNDYSHRTAVAWKETFDTEYFNTPMSYHSKGFQDSVNPRDIYTLGSQSMPSSFDMLETLPSGCCERFHSSSVHLEVHDEYIS